MAKIKKISVNAFEKVMKETYEPTTTFDWHGVEVTITKSLSIKQVIEFVDTVTSTCFTDDGNTYLPEVKDFAIKACTLEKYANFTLPKNIEAQYDLIYRTDAFECVLNHINHQQFNELCAAIAKKVEHYAQDSIEAVHRQMNDLYNAFDNLQNQISTAFAGVGEDEIKAVMKAASDGGLDEEKLVRAYTAAKSEKSGEE